MHHKQHFLPFLVCQVNVFVVAICLVPVSSKFKWLNNVSSSSNTSAFFHLLSWFNCHMKIWSGLYFGQTVIDFIPIFGCMSYFSFESRVLKFRGPLKINDIYSHCLNLPWTSFFISNQILANTIQQNRYPYILLGL